MLALDGPLHVLCQRTAVKVPWRVEHSQARESYSHVELHRARGSVRIFISDIIVIVILWIGIPKGSLSISPDCLRRDRLP